MQSKTESGTQALIAKIADAFGLEVSEQLPVTSGYRNESHPVRLKDGRKINMMIFKNGDGMTQTIRAVNEVSDFLAVNGMPARKTLDDRILSVSSGALQKYAAVYNYLPGSTISWEAYTQKHIKLLGKTMGIMHHMLQNFDASALPDVEDVYAQIIMRMDGYFRQSGVVSAMERKLELKFDVSPLKKYEVLLEHAKRLTNRQALHMDFVRGNILFIGSDETTKISGILDFEKAARGNPVFDIARTLAFLLVDCKYKQPDKVKKYFLYSGYQKRSTAALPRIKIMYGLRQTTMLETLVEFFLLYDFYKFLRHNPYEHLHENEHYVRTRDQLLRRNILFLAKPAHK